ncbi:hypothetical protein ASPFODRAFT_205739 [Aspergillus luchuensis CBS 106.47]|uniref:Uncharacterized protein n=1 Tax=Aspergillus luchuensis (strain CBS 106.47) TaxID=1137211 RepID=A0A1M3TPW7_ASPLC|nr:hypothetical protein ASPFODRAFT_205739 [Aspergillus luchuensis CBS 106.47]
MRYLDPKTIQTGPHEISKMRPVYEKHGLDPAIIYLYSILPYVDSQIANTSLFDGSSFMDFRDESCVEDGRDPLCPGPSEEDGDGPYMRPWMTALSQMGSHTSVIICDARKHRIWISDPVKNCSCDPALYDVPNEAPKSEKGTNFEHLPSRPAGDVLRDIIRWYRELKVLPGGSNDSCIKWDAGRLDVKGLYRMHGWPGNFDGDAFQVDQLRALGLASVGKYTNQILLQLKRCMISVEESDRKIARLQKSLAAAKSKDEEWMFRMELWKAERSFRRNKKDLLEEERKLIAQEYSQTKRKLESAQVRMRGARRWLEEESKDADAYTVKTVRERLRGYEQEAALYEKVQKAIEVDKIQLGNLGEKTGFAKEKEASLWKDVALHFQGEFDALREWAAQIPADAEHAKLKANEQIQDYEQSVAAKTATTWLTKPGLFEARR